MGGKTKVSVESYNTVKKLNLLNETSTKIYPSVTALSYITSPVSPTEYTQCT